MTVIPRGDTDKQSDSLSCHQGQALLASCTTVFPQAKKSEELVNLAAPIDMLAVSEVACRPARLPPSATPNAAGAAD